MLCLPQIRGVLEVWVLKGLQNGDFVSADCKELRAGFWNVPILKELTQSSQSWPGLR